MKPFFSAGRKNLGERVRRAVLVVLLAHRFEVVVEDRRREVLVHFEEDARRGRGGVGVRFKLDLGAQRIPFVLDFGHVHEVLRQAPVRVEQLAHGVEDLRAFRGFEVVGEFENDVVQSAQFDGPFPRRERDGRVVVTQRALRAVGDVP